MTVPLYVIPWDRTSERPSHGWTMLRIVTSNVRDHYSVLNEREFEARRLTVNEARPEERKSTGYSGGGGLR